MKLMLLLLLMTSKNLTASTQSFKDIPEDSIKILTIENYGFLLQWAAFGQLADSSLIPNLQERLHNDSIMLKNKDIIIENKEEHIEVQNTVIKKGKRKLIFWKSATGVAIITAIRFALKP